MNPNSLIRKPILTEKTNMIRTQQGDYSFEVHARANKIMVKNALEKLFEVKIEKCNILRVKGKQKQNRLRKSYHPGYKKAIVRLKKDSKMFDFYEGI